MIKKHFRSAVIIMILSVLSCAEISAQQITKFGVVDTAKVYQAYFRDSAPVRNYENKKAAYQKEISDQTEELQKLQQQKVEYEKAGKQAAALRIESEIAKKSDFLNEYTNAKNVELELLKKSLRSSDDFYRKLYDTLAKIAESEGYSMILSLQQSNSILWYSPSVDITDEVISDLGL